MSLAARVLVVMGVAGSGKTTLGRVLAARRGWAFEEGDDLHPAANIAKMSAGHPLDDRDRAPWLEAVGRQIDSWLGEGRSGVITCSALKRAYRDILRQGRPAVRFVFLEGPASLMDRRLAARPGHFMPASLVDSQFADLEPPGPDEGVITVDAAAGTDLQVGRVTAALEEDASAGPPADASSGDRRPCR
ncbi:MAG: gluconokinase [Proteobacteria bacterium]|nr:gluconokinase [Pseudomonadota bacterium]